MPPTTGEPPPGELTDPQGAQPGATHAGTSAADRTAPAEPLAEVEPLAGQARAAAPESADRVLTVPNLLSVLRLLGVPLFLWLLLGPHADGWAILVLALSGLSDWADGKLARLLNQTSRLGVLLDPAADRLYILATLVAFVVRDIIPLWLAVVLVGRDVLLSLTLPVLRRHGYGPPPVHQLGKAATLALLYAFPLLLLATGHGTPSDIARPIGWAFIIWGTALYVWAGMLYLLQVVQLVRADIAEQAGAAEQAGGAGGGAGAGAGGL